MATAALRAIRFGVRFDPSPEEAIGVYLRRRVVGERLPDTAGVIYEADMYKFEPKELAAAYRRLPKTHNRFFFTTCLRKKPENGNRMSRTAGPGTWVASGGKKDVKNSAGETIGTRETLKYAYRDKARKSEWLMEEYRCCGLDQFAVDVNGNETVLCRLYVSPNSKEGSVTLQESAAGDRLPGMQEPASAMAPAAEQQTTMALQQQQPPRRQEPALPAITQPQSSIKKQVPKRPAPQLVEPPRSKRMRPTLEPLKVPLRPRYDIVTSNTPTRSSRCPPPAMPRPQQQASRPSPRATPRRCPRKSPRSRPVAPPPPPAAESSTNDIDEFTRLLEAHLLEEDNGIIQEEACNDDSLARLAEPEMAPEEDHAMIQEETGDDARLPHSQLEMDTEEIPEDDEDDDDEEVEEEPAVTEHGGETQEEKEGQHHQHATSSMELEGLVVADERGDDVAAQDLWDALNSDMDEPIDGTDWASLPLSASCGSFTSPQ